MSLPDDAQTAADSVKRHGWLAPAAMAAVKAFQLAWNAYVQSGPQPAEAPLVADGKWGPATMHAAIETGARGAPGAYYDPSSGGAQAAHPEGGPSSWDPEAYAALWTIYDKTGIRPEWLLPVLDYESGLNPSARNSLGYTGLNQINEGFLKAHGISPSDYVTWPASKQLLEVVLPYMESEVSTYGKLQSAIRTYQANFLPATLNTARTLASVIASALHDPFGWYKENSGFDWHHQGVITVADLAHAVTGTAANPIVRAAIARAYALRPNLRPLDAVYGLDFPVPGGREFPWLLAGLGGSIVVGLLAWKLGGPAA